MKTLVVSCMIAVASTILLGAQGDSSHPAKEPRDAEPARFDPQSYYPAFYAAVVEAMVTKGFEGDSDFTEKHRSEVIAYIYQRKSKQEFADQFEKVFGQLLEAVRKSGNFAGKEVERAIGGTDNVAMPIAMMISSESIEVYRRKVLHPDFTAPFFANTNDPEEAALIAWIQRKMLDGEVDQLGLGGFSCEAGDEIYLFRSPPVTWKILTGRSGYLVVRRGRVVHHVVKEMN